MSAVSLKNLGLTRVRKSKDIRVLDKVGRRVSIVVEEVEAVNVVNKTVAIVIHPRSPLGLALVGPYVPREVLVVAKHAGINHRHDEVGTIVLYTESCESRDFVEVPGLAGGGSVSP